MQDNLFPVLEALFGKQSKKEKKIVKDNVRKMSRLLFESNEYWTADNTDEGHEMLPDYIFVANGESHESFIVIVLPLGESKK